MSQPNDPTDDAHEIPDFPPALIDAMTDYARASLGWLIGIPADADAPSWDAAYYRLYAEIAQWHATTGAAKIHARIADHLLSIDDASTPGSVDLARGRALGLVEALTILGGQR